MFDVNFFDAISTLSAVVTALVAIWIFYYSKKQRQYEFLQQSIDVLQRINEKALESDENVLAAIKSANPEDCTSIDEARRIYFHYMRINRIYRTYEFLQAGYITKKLAEKVFQPYIPTLKSIEDKLPNIMHRGYPHDFKDWLVKKVKESNISPPINQEE